MRLTVGLGNPVIKLWEFILWLITGIYILSGLAIILGSMIINSSSSTGCVGICKPLTLIGEYGFFSIIYLQVLVTIILWYFVIKLKRSLSIWGKIAKGVMWLIIIMSAISALGFLFGILSLQLYCSDIKSWCTFFYLVGIGGGLTLWLPQIILLLHFMIKLRKNNKTLSDL